MNNDQASNTQQQTASAESIDPQKYIKQEDHFRALLEVEAKKKKEGLLKNILFGFIGAVIGAGGTYAAVRTTSAKA